MSLCGGMHEAKSASRSGDRGYAERRVTCNGATCDFSVTIKPQWSMPISPSGVAMNCSGAVDQMWCRPQHLACMNNRLRQGRGSEPATRSISRRGKLPEPAPQGSLQGAKQYSQIPGVLVSYLLCGDKVNEKASGAAEGS